MNNIVLKNPDKWQTITVTFDGFNFNQTTTQHGAMLIKLSEAVMELGGAEEAIDAIVEHIRNGFTGKFGDVKINNIREIVHAVDKMEERYND